MSRAKSKQLQAPRTARLPEGGELLEAGSFRTESGQNLNSGDGELAALPRCLEADGWK